MKKPRYIITLGVALIAAVVLAACGGKQAPKTFPIPEPDYNAKLTLDFSPFEEAMATLSDERRAELDQYLNTADITDIQAKFEDGSLTSEELTIYYLDRIKRYDVDNFNSVMALNPNALEDARARDAERAQGQANSPMHGIPVLFKNNIAIKGMPTAAGAVAMKDWIPDRDAAVTASLREKGAVILGHANLSEWANWMDVDMPSGFSALGGQTRNPYGPFDTLGSSSGSAVAAAANFAVVTVGTETQGSLLAPANNNSAVGLKPTHDLVSGDHIIPLMPFQDNAGPMARNVTNLAILLSAMVTPVDGDADAQAQAGTDYYQYILDNVQKLPGRRIGMTAENDGVRQILEANGYEVVLFDKKDVPKQAPAVGDLLPAVFKMAINDFLPSVNAPVKSLEEVIAFNNEDLKNRAPYGQDNLEASQNSKLSREDTEKKIQDQTSKYQDKLTAMFDKYQVDVVVDTSRFIGAPLLQYYDPAGWPAMVIPIGYQDNGMPFSLGFVARPYQEGEMLLAAVVIEQSIKQWHAPDLDATIKMLDEKLGDKK